MLLKAPPKLVCTKNTALRTCLEINIALGIYLSTHFLCVAFFVHTHGGALSNIYVYCNKSIQSPTSLNIVVLNSKDWQGKQQNVKNFNLQ